LKTKLADLGQKSLYLASKIADKLAVVADKSADISQKVLTENESTDSKQVSQITEENASYNYADDDKISNNAF